MYLVSLTVIPLLTCVSAVLPSQSRHVGLGGEAEAHFRGAHCQVRASFAKRRLISSAGCSALQDGCWCVARDCWPALLQAATLRAAPRSHAELVD